MAEDARSRGSRRRDPVELDWGGTKYDNVNRRMIYGKIIAERILNKGTVKGLIQKVWNVSNGLTIAEVGKNAFLFTFSKESDCRRVLCEGPWTVMGHLINIVPWQPLKAVEEMDSPYCDFWVQFHVENPWVRGAVTRSFGRARVKLDIREPFLGGLWVPRPNLPKLWVAMKYEKLQNFCYGCGVLGHDIKGCDKEGGGEEQEGDYGSWLGTGPTKILGKLIDVVDGVPMDDDSDLEEEACDEGIACKARGVDGIAADDMECDLLGENDGFCNNPDTGGMRGLVTIKQEAMQKDPCGVEAGCAKGDVQCQNGRSSSSSGGLGGFKDPLVYARASILEEAQMDVDKKGKGVGVFKHFRSPSKERRWRRNCRPDYFVESPSDEEKENNSFAIVCSSVKVHMVEYLSSNLNRVSLKRKAIGVLSLSSSKKSRGFSGIDDVLVKDISIFQKGAFSTPSKKKSKRIKSLSKQLEGCDEDLVDVPVGVADGVFFGIFSAKGNHLKDILRKSEPSLVFLMETKCISKKMENLRNRWFRQGSSFYVDPIGQSGGLAVWWVDGLDIDVLHFSKNFIHMHVSSTDGDLNCFVTLIYGAPKEKDRENVWERIRKFAPVEGEGWLCVGDFNEISSPFEKQGGRVKSVSSLIRFQKFMSDCLLMDMNFNGAKFTWCNKAQVFHLEPLGSDHCPIMVHLDFKDNLTPWVFKFEKMWTSHPQFKDVIMEAWSGSSQEECRAVDLFLKKLWRCRNFLIDWSKVEFPNNRKMIKELKEQFENCMSGEFSVEKRDLAEALNLSDALEYVEVAISGEDNDDLRRPVSFEEVKFAAFELGDLKAPGPDGFSGSFYRHSWDIVGSGIFEMGIKLARGCPWLSHAFFADDAMFFFQASRDNTDMLKRILDLYCAASGQKANFDKSCIFFSENTASPCKAEICEILDIQASVSPGNYLGLPLMWGRSKKVALGFIRGKVQSRIKGWKQGLLTQSGREVLIKSVASAVPIYPMACFKFPKVVCDDLNRELAKFWWGQKKEEGRIHWMAWDKLTKSKKDGGMGFRDFEAFNLAMLAKQCWRILSCPEEPWVKILKGIYFPNKGFLEAGRGARASWAWSSLLEGRKLLESGLCRSIGSGSSVKFWSDPWVPSLEGFRISSPPPNAEASNQLVADFIVDGCWDAGKVISVVSSVEAQAICSIPISRNYREKPDRYVWTKIKNGDYVVKSGYFSAVAGKKGKISLAASSSYSPPKDLWKRIWALKTVPKVKNFLWKACSNALPTKSALFRRKCAKGNVCPVCLVEEESVEHLFLHCGLTRDVWFSSDLACKPVSLNFARFEDWCQHLLTNFIHLDDRDMFLFAVTCWQIWKARCDVVYQACVWDPYAINGAAKRLHGDFWKSFANDQTVWRCGSCVSKDSDLRWVPPAPGCLKINVDGAFNPVSKEAGSASVVRNSDGLTVAGRSSSVEAHSASFAEVCAVKMALELAHDLQFGSVLLESDCLEVVSALNKSSLDVDWRCHNLVLGILTLSKEFSHCQFSWIPREANQVANWVAGSAAKLLCPLDWVSKPPVALAHLLSLDAPCPREGVG
ncbi:reverse transcriptase [Senna tora]|uniref:Reverse transcriptase n=1 Tax=Senna tora TaxID=362788 RepID=A0A834TQB8_9FABA|nr:reverse transcriptase [Senna tora]